MGRQHSGVWSVESDASWGFHSTIKITVICLMGLLLYLDDRPVARCLNAEGQSLPHPDRPHPVASQVSLVDISSILSS